MKEQFELVIVSVISYYLGPHQQHTDSSLSPVLGYLMLKVKFILICEPFHISREKQLYKGGYYTH